MLSTLALLLSDVRNEGDTAVTPFEWLHADGTRVLHHLSQQHVVASCTTGESATLLHVLMKRCSPVAVSAVASLVSESVSAVVRSLPIHHFDIAGSTMLVRPAEVSLGTGSAGAGAGTGSSHPSHRPGHRSQHDDGVVPVVSEGSDGHSSDDGIDHPFELIEPPSALFSDFLDGMFQFDDGGSDDENSDDDDDDDGSRSHSDSDHSDDDGDGRHSHRLLGLGAGDGGRRASTEVVKVMLGPAKLSSITATVPVKLSLVPTIVSAVNGAIICRLQTPAGPPLTTSLQCQLLAEVRPAPL